MEQRPSNDGRFLFRFQVALDLSRLIRPDFQIELFDRLGLFLNCSIVSLVEIAFAPGHTLFVVLGKSLQGHDLTSLNAGQIPGHRLLVG